MNAWKMIRTCPEGVPVNTRLVDGYDKNGPINVRNEQVLTKKGNLFWADGVYVYYTPTEWCEI